uniref:Methyltransferase domain-containing protein n=1 Tax=Tetranychus urticae TaxID=32264 RepID=T1KWI3_TETUR
MMLLQILNAPAAERKKNSILSILRKVLSPDKQLSALEVASGSGQHVTWFAQHFPNITWQPTEYDADSLKSIEAHRESCEQAKTRVKPAQLVDITQPIECWPQQVAQQRYDFILNINMIHISPYTCTIGLFRAGAELLKNDGLIILYGPFAVDGVLSPESNVAFDRSLRSRDPDWGVRDTRDVIQTGK